MKKESEKYRESERKREGEREIYVYIERKKER